MKSAPEETPLPPNAHLWVVDQITEETATIEVDGALTTTVPVWVLPRDVAEGDVVRVKHDRRSDRSILMIVRDDEERRKRLERSVRQVAKTSKNDTPGDVTL
jgi:hypothetical protein